ncbi:MAG: hypothetical protein M3Y83_17725 [Actinomycetota bacterium]|nr:hypothetical protein [Actinomycetota bacterium]
MIGELIGRTVAGCQHGKQFGVLRDLSRDGCAGAVESFADPLRVRDEK